jgi:iron complex outermembrane receptor protein
MKKSKYLSLKSSTILTVLFFLINITTLLAQQGTGRVIDKQTLHPIAGAEIKIDGQIKMVTNQDGYFSFKCGLDSKLEISAQDYSISIFVVNNCNDVYSLQLIRSQVMEAVEVTATANSKSKLDIPGSIATLSATELKRGNGLFLDDAINTNVPGVYMQRRTISAGQNFNIRGYGNGVRGTNGMSSNFDTQGTKVYYNGIPLTDAEGITLMDDIDFGSIGHVEVQKGPSGSLYGLAIAGVVNLTTIKPVAGKTTIGQEVLLGSYGLQRYTTSVQIGSSRSSLLVNYGKQLYEGFMPHTNSRKDFINVVGNVDISEKQTVSYYIGYSDSYDSRNGELTAGQYDTLDYSGNQAYIKNNAHSNVISTRAGISNTYRFNRYLSNTTTVFGSGMVTNASSAGGWTDKTPVNYGLRSTFDVKYKLSDKIQLSGITGVEAQRQNAQTIGYAMIKDSFNLTPAAYNIIGAMKSNTYSISSTYSYFTEWAIQLPKAFTLTGGIGVSNMSIELNDRFYVASNNNPSNPNGTHKPSVYQNSFNNLVSPHFAINKIFNEQISTYLSYGVGYKAPVSSYFYIPLTGELNTSLKPEIGKQIEIGTKARLFEKRLSVELAVFQTNFVNKMTVVAVPNAANTATSYSYVANGGSQLNQGLEFAVRYEVMKKSNGIFTSFMPFFNTTLSNFKYVDFRYQQLNSSKDDVVEVDLSGKYVAGVPPMTMNAGFDLLTKYGVYGNMNYSYRDSTYYTADNSKLAQSFGILNAKIGYRAIIAKHFNIDAYFGLNNITNQQYYVMLFVNQTPDVYIPGPNKLNVFGGINLKYQF